MTKYSENRIVIDSMGNEHEAIFTENYIRSRVMWNCKVIGVGTVESIPRMDYPFRIDTIFYELKK